MGGKRKTDRDVESSKERRKSKGEKKAHGFINRKEEVQLKEVQEDDFDLKESLVAKYDGPEIAKHWNAQNKRYLLKKPNVFKRTWKAFRQGLWGNAWKYVVFYLIFYYTFNIVFIQMLCAREYASQHTLVNTGQQLLIDAMSQNSCPANGSNAGSNLTERVEDFRNQSQKLNFKYTACLGYDTKIMEWAKKEATFTRLLTFLIGFYVSFTISRWWTQVTSVPTIDNICLALQGYLWTNDSKKEDQVLVKEGVTVTQFKQTILRYCLLSWTMCLCFLSRPLNRKFKKPKDFNNQRLLTSEEYDKLKTPNDSDDCWKMKWTVPLLWVNAMLNEAETLTKGGKDFKIKELKEILKTTTEFQKRLHQVFEFNENMIPDLIIQAIKLGLHFWLLFGILSSQGLINEEAGVPMYVALILNAPVLHTIKYVVMFGWMKAASFLQNPFGEDEHDLSLPIFLDTEIWKASCYIHQTTPPKQQRTSEQIAEGWETFGIALKEE